MIETVTMTGKFGLVLKESDVDYGMYTDVGNKVIDVLVKTAKRNNFTLDQSYRMLEDISEVPGLEEATDTEVREIFFSVLGYYDVA